MSLAFTPYNILCLLSPAGGEIHKALCFGSPCAPQKRGRDAPTPRPTAILSPGKRVCVHFAPQELYAVDKHNASGIRLLQKRQSKGDILILLNLRNKSNRFLLFACIFRRTARKGRFFRGFFGLLRIPTKRLPLDFLFFDRLQRSGKNAGLYIRYAAPTFARSLCTRGFFRL